MTAAPEPTPPPIPWEAWTAPVTPSSHRILARAEAPEPLDWASLVGRTAATPGPERPGHREPEALSATAPHAPAAPGHREPTALSATAPAGLNLTARLPAIDAAAARELAAIARATARAQQATADAHAQWLAMAMAPPWSRSSG